MEKIKDFGTKTLEYFRIKDRPAPEICSGKYPIPKAFLEKIFNKKIPREKYDYYRRKFLRNCETLTKELNNLFSDNEYINDLHSNIYNYIPREYQIPYKKSLEILINLIMFAGSNFINYSDYLLNYPSGQKLVVNVFQNPDDYNALYNLYSIVYTANLSKTYDETLFKKEFFKVIPDLTDFIPNRFLQDEYLKWITNKISTLSFLKVLEAILKRHKIE